MAERATRLALALSAAMAVGFETYLGARVSPHLIGLNAALFVLAFAASRWHRRAALWLVLLPAYLLPALVLTFTHGFDDALWSMWTSLLLGYVLARAPGAGWALPRGWRWPLSLWGLSVAITWPMIVWREIDFAPAQLDRYTTGVTNVGIPPAAEVLWIANVAATHLVGILWIDALYRNERDEDERGARVPWAVAPLLVSAVASAAVAVYQMFANIVALNDTVFAVFHRAAGAMVDANAFGMIAALWAAGAVAVAASAASSPARVAAAVAAVVLFVGLWGSGSQSALFAACIAGVGAAAGLWRLPAMRRPAVAWTTIAVAALLVTGVVVSSMGSSEAVGPIARIRERWAQAADEGRTGLVKVLWNRDGYGTAAAAMIREFPLTGVGVGMFNSFVVDESLRIGIGPEAPDNAQNWFRHQLAEMGLLGSLGWIIWLGVYLPSLWRLPAEGVSPVATYVVRGALAGIGLASLVAMPTQNGAALITFWTFVFWHARLSRGRSRPETAQVVARVSNRAWAAAAILVLVYAGLVWRVGAHELRVPVRAATLGWPYDHGAYDLETPAVGPAFRWTTQRAVLAVVIPPDPGPAGERYLPLTFWAHHPDLAARPLHVKIWLRGRLAIDMTLTDSRPVTRYLRLASGERGVMIETWVDRTWRPSTAGEHDRRTLGIALAAEPPVCCPSPATAILD